MDEYIEAMKAMGRRCGELIGVANAEGFRQHLGHGYPQDNLLVQELGRWSICGLPRGEQRCERLERNELAVRHDRVAVTEQDHPRACDP